MAKRVVRLWRGTQNSEMGAGQALDIFEKSDAIKELRTKKRMKNGKELKWGSILSYAQMALNIVIGIVYTPLMIRLLGQSEYGLYNTVSSTVSMLSILGFGFNTSYIRFFSKYKKQGDYERIYGLNGLFLLIFSIIGVVAFLCGIFLTTHLELVFQDGLTQQEYEIARVLMLLLTINMTFSFPATVFSTIIWANERFIFLKSLGMIRTVLSPLVNLPLMLLGFRSIALVSASLFFSIITDLIYIFYVFNKLHYRFSLHGIEKGLFRGLFGFTFFIAVNIVVDQINNNIDRVLLGRFVGTAAVSVYAVGASLYYYYLQFSTAISGVFTPKIHQTYNAYEDSQKRDRELTELFIKVGRIQCLVLMLISSGLIIFGKSFICLWVGEGYDASFYVAMLLILPATVPLMQNLGIEIQRAANKHQFQSIVYLAMAICNLLLTIYLCQLYGAVGAAVGTSISTVLANGIVMNIFYYKKLGINIPLFWVNILKLMLGMIPAFLLGAFIIGFVKIQSWAGLLLWIIIYSAVFFVSSWLISMNAFEKSLVISSVKKLLRRVSSQTKDGLEKHD